MDSANRIVFVGEAPSRTSDPGSPFSGHSGDRLRELLGRDLEAFELRNLFAAWPGASAKGSAFDVAAGRGTAVIIFYEAALNGDRLVLVGKRVASAFRLSADYLVWQRPILGVRVAVFPHPSRVNRWWNDPENVERARRFLRYLS